MLQQEAMGMYGEAGELAHRLCRTATAENSYTVLLQML
jgi:hypothetical protein